MDTLRFMVKKIAYLAVTLFAIILTNFLLFRIMPGDPVRAFIPKGISPELADLIRDRFHLNDPWYEQFYYYLIQVFHLDFGVTSSYQMGTEVIDILIPRIFNTMVLVGFGTAIAIFAGVALGRYVAWRRGQAADTIGMTFTLTFYTMPTFLRISTGSVPGP